MAKWSACRRVLAEADLAADPKKADRILAPEAGPCQDSSKLAPAKVSNEDEPAPDLSIAGDQSIHVCLKKSPLKPPSSALLSRFKGPDPDRGLEVGSLRARCPISSQ